jgi:hypothetical protein
MASICRNHYERYEADGMTAKIDPIALPEMAKRNEIPSLQLAA